MKNIQIENIVIWAKNPSLEPKILSFAKGKINIIYGLSQTGKSAIIPIIDYCLGSTQNKIPVGHIRDYSAWFGIVLNITFSSILFYISFCLTRNFAGGIHANSEIKCDIITTVSILISEILIKIFIDYSLVNISFVMLIISSICLCVIKPVSSSQKEISQKEKLCFHKKLILIVCFMLIFSLNFLYFNCYIVIYSISIGMTLSTFLFLLGKVHNFKIQKSL